MLKVANIDDLHLTDRPDLLFSTVEESRTFTIYPALSLKNMQCLSGKNARTYSIHSHPWSTVPVTCDIIINISDLFIRKDEKSWLRSSCMHDHLLHYSAADSNQRELPSMCCGRIWYSLQLHSGK
jgi:hypothetical protein